MDRISFPLINVDYVSIQAQWYITLTARSIPLTNFLTLPAFGFLAGKEVKAAGVSNLGLQDRKLCSCSSSPIR